jgi:hypothetical protein
MDIPIDTEIKEIRVRRPVIINSYTKTAYYLTTPENLLRTVSSSVLLVIRPGCTGFPSLFEL